MGRDVFDVNGVKVRLSEKGAASAERFKMVTGHEVDVDAILEPVRQGKAKLSAYGYSKAFDIIEPGEASAGAPLEATPEARS